MRLSTTLSIYIGRQFIWSFIGLLLAILLIVLLFDIVELIRRAHGHKEVTFPQLLEMALLKLPYMGQQVFPFAALFGGMLTFWKLARHHELVVSRAAGISAWQFLLPVITISFLLGVFLTTALNPLASASLSQFERRESIVLDGQQNLLALGDSGIWLRQSNSEGQAVIRASQILTSDNDITIKDITVFRYRGMDEFYQRLDAEIAILEDGFWHIKNAQVQEPEKLPVFEGIVWLETDLTLSNIQDSFAPPQTMSFWSLPNFVEKLEKSGFSAIRHRLHLHSLLAAPLLMCAMVLIAATFSLRHSRRGGVSYVVTGGVLTGFILYFFSDIVFALGQSDSIPVILAAWTPSGVATLLGLAMLLHLEDG